MSRREIREALAAAAKPNLMDRAIDYFNPVAGARRLRARMFSAVAGGYTGASKSRRQTAEWSYTKNSSADADAITDLPDLRDRSRDLLRNAPLASGAIAGVVTSVVGTGLALQSRIDAAALGMNDAEAEAWQDAAEREWRLWCEGSACDAARTLDFYGLQALAFRAALESGDVFALTPMRRLRGEPYALCLNIIEADRVSNPKGRTNTSTFVGGVELDGYGAPVAYHIQRSHPGALSRISFEWDRIEAFGPKTGRRQVVHLYDKLRPGQTRGVPYLAPVIETLKMLDRYTEAELMAAVIAGMFTVFVESERGGLDPNDGSGIGAETGAQASDKDVKLGSGAIVDLTPGEKVSFANPQRPNQAFDGFVLSLCRFIAVALEIPYEVLVKHFTASYSASRAALQEAWKFYRRRRTWLAAMFCGPVYEAWMDEAVAIGRIAAPGYFEDPLLRRAYLGADWVGDGPISLDPVKDVTAAKDRVDMGMTTLAKETALHDGGDWKENHRQRVKEAAARREAGLDAGAAGQPGAPARAPADAGKDGGDLETGDRAYSSMADAILKSADATTAVANALTNQPSPKVVFEKGAIHTEVHPADVSVTVEKGGATRTVVEKRDSEGRIAATRSEEIAE
ncbi:MAG: phage portal protein [Bauldia sp.]